jgi:hypothetical protein
MSVGSLLMDPLRGKTSLSKVFWVYGLLGSIVVSALGAVFDPGNQLAMRLYTVFSFLYTLYAIVATYRCAGNCRSTFVARMARISAVISLVALPVLAYLYFSGAVDIALTTLSGEQ